MLLLIRNSIHFNILSILYKVLLRFAVPSNVEKRRCYANAKRTHI